MRLLIIGGSDAGIEAGLGARSLDEDAEVTLKAAGLNLRLGERAIAIDPYAHVVTTDGGERHGYDRLVIATGARPQRPPISGLDGLGPADGVHELHTMDDTALLAVTGVGGYRGVADLVLIVTGVRPDTELAVAAGVTTGAGGALAVDRRMRTKLPDVYAAGDCVHTFHRLLDQHVYLPVGTPAHKQGRVAGQNTVGGDQVFAGVLGTQVVKVFDLVAAATMAGRPSVITRWRAPGPPAVRRRPGG